MKLKLLHEESYGALSELVASVVDTLRARLEESGYHVISGVAGPSIGYVRVLGLERWHSCGIQSKSVVTITIHKDKLPTVFVDVGLQGIGIQDKMQVNLDDHDAMDRILAFTSRFIVVGDDIKDLFKKYGYELPE